MFRHLLLILTLVWVLLISESEGAKIVAWPTVLKKSGDLVRISFSLDNHDRLKSNSAECYNIGIFRLPHRLTTVGQFENIDKNGSVLSGEIEFQLLNVRSSYIWFSICAGSCENKANIISTSNPVTFEEGAHELLHGRLSLGPSHNSMRVMFTSGKPLFPPQVEITYQNPFHSAAKTVSHVYDGESIAPYSITDMCFEPATDKAVFSCPGWQHDVLLTELKPSERVYYRYGSNMTGIWSTWAWFETPKSTPVGEVETHVIFGDMGVGVDYKPTGGSSYIPAKQSVRWMMKAIGIKTRDNYLPTSDSWMKKNRKWRVPSIIIHIGDISYARGYPMIWEEFLHSIEPIARRVPYMVSVGNHEYDYRGYGMDWAPLWWSGGKDSGGECGVPFSNLFHMPIPLRSEFLPKATGRKNTRNLWYSFKKGSISYVMMSTESDLSSGPQLKFLENTLQRVNRDETPWIVFTGHRPAYTSTADPPVSIDAIYYRKILEPLFRKYRVDVAFWGHQHQYERLCAMVSDFTCASEKNVTSGVTLGTVHMVVGNAGNTYMDPWIYPEPKYVKYRSRSFGVTTVTSDRSFLRIDYHGAIPERVHDSFTIHKGDEPVSVTMKEAYA